MGEASRLSSAFEDAQKTLTAYADELEEMKVYIHRDLLTLPKEYIEHVNAYLTEAAKNIKLRIKIEEFELNYEKARGAQFDCVHERDKIKAELDQFTLDVDKELEKLEAVRTWLTKAKAQGHISISQGDKLDEILEEASGGILVGGGSPEDLAAGIGRVLAGGPLEPPVLPERFQPERIAAAYFELFERLAS